MLGRVVLVIAILGKLKQLGHNTTGWKLRANDDDGGDGGGSSFSLWLLRVHARTYARTDARSTSKRNHEIYETYEIQSVCVRSYVRA